MRVQDNTGKLMIITIVGRLKLLIIQQFIKKVALIRDIKSPD